MANLVNAVLTIKAKLKHSGYGYEITQEGKVRMRVTSQNVLAEDIVVSCECLGGNISSMVVIRDISKCEFEPISLVSY